MPFQPLSEGSSWELSPSYKEFLVGSYNFVTNNIAKTRGNYSFVSETRQDFVKCIHNLEWFDFFLIIGLSFVWTLLRHLSTVFIFQPLGTHFRLPRSEREKLPESGWKFSFYLCSWSLVAYILLLQKDSQYFHRPSTIWNDYSMNLTVPTNIYAIYVAQISFYVHSLYATVFVDQWRRDSIVLIGHHIITAVLLVFSLATRCHKAGLIAIFLHDICDILLEGTKTSLYFKQQGNRALRIFEHIADVGFACFAVTWFVARLYFFPLRHVYTSSVYLDEKQIQIPFIFFLNTLLYVLLAMNIYWFSFILNLLYKVITGQVLEDNRDYDGEELLEKENQKQAQTASNQLEEKEQDEQVKRIKDGKEDDDKSGYFLRQRRQHETVASVSDEVALDSTQGGRSN